MHNIQPKYIKVKCLFMYLAIKEAVIFQSNSNLYEYLNAVNQLFSKFNSITGKCTLYNTKHIIHIFLNILD